MSLYVPAQFVLERGASDRDRLFAFWKDLPDAARDTLLSFTPAQVLDELVQTMTQQRVLLRAAAAERDYADGAMVGPMRQYPWEATPQHHYAESRVGATFFDDTPAKLGADIGLRNAYAGSGDRVLAEALLRAPGSHRRLTAELLLRRGLGVDTRAAPPTLRPAPYTFESWDAEEVEYADANRVRALCDYMRLPEPSDVQLQATQVVPTPAADPRNAGPEDWAWSARHVEEGRLGTNGTVPTAGDLGAIAFAAGSRLDRMRLIKPPAGIRTPETKPPTAAYGLPGSALCPGPCAPNDVVRFSLPPHAVPELPYDITADPLRPAVPRWASTLQRGDRDLPLCADPEHVESREFADALALYAQSCMQLWDMPRILADVMKVVRVALNTGQSTVRLDAVLRRILPSVTGPSTAILEGVTYAVAPPTEDVVPGRCWPPPPRLDEPLTEAQRRDTCANLLGAMRELAKGAGGAESALSPRPAPGAAGGPAAAASHSTDEAIAAFASQVAASPLLERHRGSGCKVSQVWNPRAGQADAHVWRLEAWQVLPHASDTTGNGADPNDSVTSFMSDWSLDGSSASSDCGDESEGSNVAAAGRAARTDGVVSSSDDGGSDSDDFLVTDEAEREFLAQVRAGDDIVPAADMTRHRRSGPRRFDAATDPVFAQAAALLAESNKARRRLRRDKNRLRASLMEPGDGKALEEVCRLPYMDDMMVWVLVHSIFCAMRVAVRRVGTCRGACSRVDERTLFTTSVPDHLRLVNGGAPRTTTHTVSGNVFAAALRATSHGRTSLKESQQGLLGIEDHWAIPSFEGGLGAPACDPLESAVARIRPLVADGERAMRLGVSDRAAAAFTQAIDYATPSVPRLIAQALCGRATAYQAAGAHLLTVQDCTAALMLDPTALEAHFVRATTYALLAESAWAARHRMGKSFFVCAMLNFASLAASGDRRMTVQAAAAANRLLYRIYRQNFCMLQEAGAKASAAGATGEGVGDEDTFLDSAMAEAEARVRRLEEWSTADPHFIPDHDDGADEVDAAIQRRAAASAGPATSCCRLELWLNEPLVLPTDVTSAFPLALTAHLRRRVDQREGFCKRVEARFATPDAATAASAPGVDPVFPWEAGWAPLFATGEPAGKESPSAAMRSSWAAGDGYDDRAGTGTHRRVVGPDGPTNRVRRAVCDWANARPGARQWGHWLVCGNPLTRAVPAWLSGAVATQANEDAFRDAAFLRTAQTAAASHPEVVAACGALPAAVIDLTIALVVQPSLRRAPQYWAALAQRQVDLDTRARDKSAHSVAQPMYSAGRPEPHAMDVAAAAYNYFARHPEARPPESDTERAAAARADGSADDAKSAASGTAFPPPQSKVQRTAQETMADWFTPMPTGPNGSSAYIRAQYLAAAEATAHELEGPLRDAELRVQRRLQEELMKIPDFNALSTDRSAVRAAAGGASSAASTATAAAATPTGSSMPPSALPSASMSDILDVLTGKKSTQGARGGGGGAFSTILQTLEKQLQGAASPSAVAGGPNSIAFQQEIEQRLLQLGIRLPPSINVGAAFEGMEAEEAARMAEAMQHVVSKRPKHGALAAATAAASAWGRPSVSDPNARALLGGATVEETLQFIMGDERDTIKGGKRKGDKKKETAPSGKKKGAAQQAAKVGAKKGAAPTAASGATTKPSGKPAPAPRTASAAPSTSTAFTGRAFGESVLDDDDADLSTDPDSDLFEMDSDFLHPGACAFGLRDEGVGAVDEGLDDDDFDEEAEEEELAAALTVFEALRAANQLKRQQREHEDAAAAATAALDKTSASPAAPKSTTSRGSVSTAATVSTSAKAKPAVKDIHPVQAPSTKAKGSAGQQPTKREQEPPTPPAEPAKTKQQLQHEREQQEARERKERDRMKRLRTIEANLQQLQERGVKERKPCEIEEHKGFERILGAAAHSLKVAKGKEVSRLAAEAARAEADRTAAARAVAAEKAAAEAQERNDRERKTAAEKAAADRSTKAKVAGDAETASVAAAAAAAAAAVSASASGQTTTGKQRPTTAIAPVPSNQKVQHPQPQSAKSWTEVAAGLVETPTSVAADEAGNTLEKGVAAASAKLEAPAAGKGGKTVLQRPKDAAAPTAPSVLPPAPSVQQVASTLPPTPARSIPGTTIAASPSPQPPSQPPPQAPQSPALAAAPPSYTEFLTGMTPPSLRPALPRGVTATPVSLAAATRWPPAAAGGTALHDDGGLRFDLTALAALTDPGLAPLDALAPGTRGPSAPGPSVGAGTGPSAVSPMATEPRRGPSLLSALRDGGADADDEDSDVAGEMLLLLSASAGAAPTPAPNAHPAATAALLGAAGGLVGAPSAAPSWPTPPVPAASAMGGSAQLFGLWEDDDIPTGSAARLGVATPLVLPAARAPLLDASLGGLAQLSPAAAVTAPGSSALLDVASIWGAPEPMSTGGSFSLTATSAAVGTSASVDGALPASTASTAGATVASPLWRAAAPAGAVTSASPLARTDGARESAPGAPMRPPLRALQLVARYPDDADVRQSAEIARRAAAAFHAPPDVVAAIAAAIVGANAAPVTAGAGALRQSGGGSGIASAGATASGGARLDAARRVAGAAGGAATTGGSRRR